MEIFEEKKIIEARNFSVPAFARFRRSWIGALRKIVLEHFTSICGILNEI